MFDIPSIDFSWVPSIDFSWVPPSIVFVCFLKSIGIGMLIGFFSPIGILLALMCCGICVDGAVMAGSVAARVQSTCYGAATGGCFAIAQRVAANPRLLLPLAALLSIGGGVAGGFYASNICKP
eukprot:TRINITY_DN17765_c0_g1_i1.p1 TRINITY_DN17765_c0_g1~~TRINITY_DN17765_c0_g1_i1.p1  ORF type:complete len:123 (+),score=5.77 TRINITY_DN17765_c0_g1_i1:41-409(+)